MKRKIFVVSDIHGHATLLIEALNEAGFDPRNKEHLLIVCGDCFDRGSENKAVMAYLKAVKNKILVRGNHEDMLIAVIERGSLKYHDFHNGTDITLLQFLGQSNVDAYGVITSNYATCDILTEFGNSMLDYYETENYCFTHGWLPLKATDEGTRIKDDWRYARFSDWKKARFSEWNNVYSKDTVLENKTIVCGHRSTTYGYLFDPTRRTRDSSPFFRKGMIAIDACTIVSHRVNVVVLEDEVRESKTFEMNLRDDMFDLISTGSKIVEMRVLDEKRREISTGDKIEFTSDADENKKLTVTVTGLNVYKTFYELATDFSPLSLGFYDKTPREIAAIMDGIYEQKLKDCKPLAIRISL